jgi:hypothetical protein
VSGPGGRFRIGLIEEAFELADELVGRASVAGAQHEHVRVDPRREIPPLSFEPRDHDRREMGEHAEGDHEHRSHDRQDGQAVAVDPELQRDAAAGN